MTQPTIITAQSKGYAPLSDANSATRTYEDVVIPANANTVMMVCIMDTSEPIRTFTNLTYGNAAAVRTFLIDVSSERPRCVVGAIFDVSAAGAMTADVTVTIDSATSVETRFGIVCSDGFVESFQTTNDASAIEGQSIAYSGNYENNIFVLIGGTDDLNGGFSYTTGTEIFQDASDTVSVAVVAGFQATNQADNTKKIAYTAAAEEMGEYGVFLSTQRNPFATNFGPVIRPIISHDVIS